MKGKSVKTIAFHNLGCKVNAYETDAMMESLTTAGYQIVPFESEADIYIVNTCSVTNIADRKSRQMISRLRKENPAALIVATGCYVQAVANRTLFGSTSHTGGKTDPCTDPDTAKKTDQKADQNLPALS